MEQIQELLNILKETPQMALWGLGLYFLFILLKLASWVSALTLVIKLSIERYFNFREKELNIQEKKIEIQERNRKDEMNYKKYKDLEAIVEDGTFDNVTPKLNELFSVIKGDSGYMHNSDIREAINKLKSNKINT